MSGWKKLAAASAAGEALNVEDVFSTYLYEGNNGTAQSITNDIDLSGEGGLVWIKQRTQNNYHYLFDTEATGNTSALLLPLNTAPSASTTALTSFNSDGFSLGSNAGVNGTHDMVSWTFRKAPKFFDIVTWTGDGGATRTISHNLGVAPACIIVKNTSRSLNWFVHHDGLTNDNGIFLNSTGAQFGGLSGQYTIFDSATAANMTFGDAAVTTGNKIYYNNNNEDYVAYLFAHNDGDGNFGPDGDADIIKCGSYAGDGTEDGSNEIDLGFEPQWVMIKRTNATDSWVVIDNMRGWVTGRFNNDNDTQRLSPDSTLPEVSDELSNLTATGFMLRNNSSKVNANGSNYIYIAIRRGPMAVPESATDVFAIDPSHAASTSSTSWDSGFPVDMAIHREPTGAGDTFIQARLTGDSRLKTNTTGGQQSSQSHVTWESNEGWGTFNYAGATEYSWMWRRAPNYFDAVAYDGAGSATSTNLKDHNLGVKPEMIWVKHRDDLQNWVVWHKDMNYNMGESYINKAFMYLNKPDAATLSSNFWSYGGNPQMTDTQFSLGSTYDQTNKVGDPYIAYLFATLDGVSKVGAFSGTGSAQTIDCGFSSGAKMVIIKVTSSITGHWLFFDTERGIVSGNDPFTLLNLTNAQFTNVDAIDPTNSGFIVNHVSNWNLNVSGQEYIFYAVA